MVYLPESTTQITTDIYLEFEDIDGQPGLTVRSVLDPNTLTLTVEVLTDTGQRLASRVVFQGAPAAGIGHAPVPEPAVNRVRPYVYERGDNGQYEHLPIGAGPTENGDSDLRAAEEWAATVQQALR